MHISQYKEFWTNISKSTFPDLCFGCAAVYSKMDYQSKYWWHIFKKMNKILSKIWTKQLRSNFRKNFVDFWKVKRLENVVLIFPDLLTNIKKMPDSNGNPITYQSWFFKKSIIKGFCLYAVILNFYLQLLLETLKKLFLVEC